MNQTSTSIYQLQRRIFTSVNWLLLFGSVIVIYFNYQIKTSFNLIVLLYIILGIAIANFFILRSKISIYVSIVSITIAIAITTILLVYFGQNDKNTLLWWMLIPLLTMLGVDPKFGAISTIIFAILNYLSMYLGQFFGLKIAYPREVIISSTVSFVLQSFIIYLFAIHTRKQALQLEEQLDTGHKLEEQLQENLEIMHKKSQELNENQEAILNILEDLETEKKTILKANQELEKYHQAVDSAYNHIVITDIEGNITFANKAVERITGFLVKDVIGTKAGSLWGKLMPKEYYQKMWHTIKVLGKPFSGEISNHRKNNEQYQAKVTISPIFDKTKTLLGFIGTEQDITKEKEVDKMKTEFISLASHQLRTPLSAMSWFSEMLLNGDAGPLKSEQKGLVQNIHQSNQRMIDLVNSLLNISRIEAGRIIINPIPTNIQNLISDSIVEFEPVVQEKEITIKTEFRSVSRPIKVDPKLLREIYKNLISNALKYTPKKGKVKISIYKKADMLVSEISDTGMGIPKSSQPNIFGKFFRAPNVLKSQTEGTGLGLYLVKQIVNAIGGEISFVSIENKGTTFKFTIPAKNAVKKDGQVTLT